MPEFRNIGCAYIRVSDERQDEYSPDSQLKKIREYAEKQGYFIPDEYVYYDDGISGRTASKRGDFNRMIAVAKEKNRPFDVIFVWKFSRFARNQEESMVYKNLLRKKGVSVVSVSEPIPEGHFGSLIERIIEWTDEYYLVNLGVEVSRGIAEKIARGEPISTPPYGYVMRDKKLYPDEESGAAEVVRRVFRMYADGMKLREIAVLLGKQGIRTKYGNVPDNRYIDYMLRNPCYVGKLQYSKNGTRDVSRRKRGSENITVVDSSHKPIVPVELWEAVQSRINKNDKMYPKYSRANQPVQYMLKGIVRCSNCGSTLTISGTQGKGGTRYLQCCSYNRGVCTASHAITLPRINEAFLQGLHSALDEMSFQMAPAPSPSVSESAIDFDKMIDIETRRLKRAKEAYLAEIDTIDQYAKNKAEIEERIETLKRQQSEAVPPEMDRDAFAEKVRAVLDYISTPTVEEQAKNEAIRTIVEKIILYRPDNRLVIIFHDF